MANQCSDSYEKTSMIRGHHIYKSVWTPIIEEQLVLEAQDDNEYSKYAIGVMKNGCVVKHVRCSHKYI